MNSKCDILALPSDFWTHQLINYLTPEEYSLIKVLCKGSYSIYKLAKQLVLKGLLRRRCQEYIEGLAIPLWRFGNMTFRWEDVIPRTEASLTYYKGRNHIGINIFSTSVPIIIHFEKWMISFRSLNAIRGELRFAYLSLEALLK